MQLQLNIHLDDRLVALLKRLASKKAVRLGVPLVVLGSAVVAYATTIPNTFSTGETIDASQMNANFSELAKASWDGYPDGGAVRTFFGNVGIGTTTPGGLLDIGSATTRGTFYIHGAEPGVGPATLVMTDASGSGHEYDIENGGGSFGILDSTFSGLGTYRLWLDASGNVGVGTDVPTAALDVSGNMHCSGSLTQGSSRTLKERIRDLPLAEAVSALTQLQPKKYFYKADPSDEQVGFIAEDVPNLLATADRKSLDAMDFVAVLTKVTQAQQQQLAVQEQQIEVLQAEVHARRR